MKKQALVLGACVVGGIIAYKMLKKTQPGVGDDLLVPPPGRTVTASGQVLGDLGLETTYQDVFAAGPSQYRRDAVNDFMPGIQGLGGFNLKKATKSMSKAVQKAPANIAKGVTKTLKVTAPFNPVLFGANMVLNTAKIGIKMISDPKAGFKMAGRGLKSFTITPLKQVGMVVGVVKPPEQKVATGGAEYQDANGKPISKADYDKLMAAAQQSIPKKAEDYKGYAIWTVVKVNEGGGVLYLINYDPAQNACEGAYDSMAETKAAIDAVVAPPEIQAPPTISPPTTQAPVTSAPPTTYQAAQNRYTAEQAAREQASISAARDESGYGTTSNDTGYGNTSNTEFQEAPQGAPALPEQVAQVQTPSAQMLPEEMPGEATKKGNTAVGVVVGGGILAAIAAAALGR
jgi:hypothetical protein